MQYRESNRIALPVLGRTDDYEMRRRNQWARLPYPISNLLARQYFSTVGSTDSIRFFTEFLQEGVSLTPGEYRLVVFFPDGPQYAYFNITG